MLSTELPYELQSLAHLQGLVDKRKCTFVVESMPNGKLIILVRHGTNESDAYALQQVRPVLIGGEKLYKVREFNTLDGAANVLRQYFNCKSFVANIADWVTTSERKKQAR